MRASFHTEHPEGKHALTHHALCSPLAHVSRRALRSWRFLANLYDADDRRTCVPSTRAGRYPNYPMTPRTHEPTNSTQAWRKVSIAAVLVSKATGDRLRRVMALERVKVPGIGDQWAEPTARRAGGGGGDSRRDKGREL